MNIESRCSTARIGRFYRSLNVLDHARHHELLLLSPHSQDAGHHSRATRRGSVRFRRSSWFTPMERERGAWDSDTRARGTTTCVYPRDDVNTPHESTRLFGRDGRAAQFGCSRSSLVTRRNSAQVVLLCGECGTRASIYALSLPRSLSVRTFRIFHPFAFFSLLLRHCFHPRSLSPRFLSRSQPSFLLSPCRQSSYILPCRRTNWLTDWLTDCRPSTCAAEERPRWIAKSNWRAGRPRLARVCALATTRVHRI